MLLENYDAMVDALVADATHAAWDTGYMKALIDNEFVPQKMNEAISGHALHVANIAVKRNLALYCSRAWDADKDAISLPRLTAKLPTPADLINLHGGMTHLTLESDEHEIGLRVSRLHANIFEREDDNWYRSLQLFRTEWLAHRLLKSSRRAKFEAERPVEDIKLKELVERAEQTLELVGELAYLWSGRHNGFSDNIKTAEMRCRRFWSSIPRLRDIE